MWGMASHCVLTVNHDAPYNRSVTAEGQPLRAGIYTRMSLALMNDKTKVDDQERLCRDVAERNGWDVADVYCDNNKSAWKPNRKRKQWDRMLADVESGRINAIITYHGDRLIRQPMDLEKLLLLAKGKGIRLASPTGTRNLDSDEDQFVLGIEANMARRESANTSRRRRQQYERWRLAGREFACGTGGRRFGFCSDGLTLYEPDRCEVATRRTLSEADLLREMAGRVLTGETCGAIAADLNSRGHTTPAGRRFTHGTVRRLLSRPRYAGLMSDGETKAAWEPVISRAAWERVQITLDARAGANPRPTNARRWLLSGIAVCGADGCGEPLSITQSGGTKARDAMDVYGCKRKGCGRVRRNAAHLDAYVSARTVRLLNDPRQPEGELPALPDDAPEWAALTRERGETEALIADYRTSAGRSRLLMARLDGIDARLAELREREAGDARSRLLGRYRGITAAEFAALPLDVRRALVAASYRVIVLPASGRGPGFRTEDVRLEPLG